MAKLMGRNWKVKPGIKYANEGWPEPKGRAEEKRDWRTQVDAELTAEEAAHEFNMNNAIGILFGDVSPK